MVDYKTGHKEFRLSEVVEGINLQMLIYILSICQNGGPHIGDKPAVPLQEDSPIQPAGVLYLPAKLPGGPGGTGRGRRGDGKGTHQSHAHERPAAG